MRTVFVTPFVPAVGTGTTRRTLSLVHALARLGPVEVAYAPFGPGEPEAALAATNGVSLRAVAPSRGLRRGVAYARARAAGTPDGFARGASPELADVASAAGPDDRVVADGPTVAAALLPLARRRPVVYNAHNLESAFRHELAGAEATERSTLERFERRLLETMGQSWMVSRPEVQAALAIAPGADVRYVPNAVDVAAILPVTPPGARRLLFAADHTYAPNQDALAFLLDEVMAHVWRALPDARLAICGRGLDPAVGDRDERIEALGFVDDMTAVYGRCDAVAVPLRQGGGSPLKFVEAMAYALPVVATPKAAAGLEAQPGLHYLEGEEPVAFAAAVIRALGEQAGGVGPAGRELAEREYSVEALAQRLAAC